jgi:hypothetical protein
MLNALDIFRNPAFFLNVSQTAETQKQQPCLLYLFTAMTGCQTVNNLTVNSNCAAVLQADGSDMQITVLDRI